MGVERPTMAILVTGATGFVGSALTKRLATTSSDLEISVSVRHSGTTWPKNVMPIVTGDILPTTNWRTALQGVDVVVHCAARVHVMRDSASDPLHDYRLVNVDGTLNLARQAAQAGVRRFVFVSSIKVNGEATALAQPYTADDIPSPLDPYGVSKMEAERGLRELSAQTGMEVVVVRPPLVYGPAVKANFATMMRWIACGIPLPLGCIQNARSMVALDNLVDLLIICMQHPQAAGQIFLVSDGEDVSTTELLRRTAKAMGKSVMLLPVPTTWLNMGAAILGKQALAQRLCGSLQVDIAKTRRLLGWHPPLTLDQGLRKAVEGLAR